MIGCLSTNYPRTVDKGFILMHCSHKIYLKLHVQGRINFIEGCAPLL